MRESGSPAKRKDLEYTSSIVEQSMRVIESVTKSMVKAPSISGMAISTKEIGRTINKMAKVSY